MTHWVAHSKTALPKSYSDHSSSVTSLTSLPIVLDSTVMKPSRKASKLIYKSEHKTFEFQFGVSITSLLFFDYYINYFGIITDWLLSRFRYSLLWENVRNLEKVRVVFRTLQKSKIGHFWESNLRLKTIFAKKSQSKILDRVLNTPSQ